MEKDQASFDIQIDDIERHSIHIVRILKRNNPPDILKLTENLYENMKLDIKEAEKQIESIEMI